MGLGFWVRFGALHLATVDTAFSRRVLERALPIGDLLLPPPRNLDPGLRGVLGPHFERPPEPFPDPLRLRTADALESWIRSKTDPRNWEHDACSSSVFSDRLILRNTPEVLDQAAIQLRKARKRAWVPVAFEGAFVPAPTAPPGLKKLAGPALGTEACNEVERVLASAPEGSCIRFSLASTAGRLASAVGGRQVVFETTEPGTGVRLEGWAVQVQCGPFESETLPLKLAARWAPAPAEGNPEPPPAADFTADLALGRGRGALLRASGPNGTKGLEGWLFIRLR
jgi:hypothetical protein